MPPPSSTTTTPPPKRSTASRREGEDRPGLASLVIIGRTTATADRATCATPPRLARGPSSPQERQRWKRGPLPQRPDAHRRWLRVYICEGGAQHSPRQRVVIYSDPYLLDIGSRMLENRELARAMEFDGEERSREFHGNKEEVTKQTGDDAPVHLAAARLRATLAPRPLSAPTRRAGEEQAHHHQPHLHHRPLEPLDGTFPPTAASTTGPDRHRRQGHTGQQVLPHSTATTSTAPLPTRKSRTSSPAHCSAAGRNCWPSTRRREGRTAAAWP